MRTTRTRKACWRKACNTPRPLWPPVSPPTPGRRICYPSSLTSQKARNRVFFETPIRALWVKTLARVIETRLTRGARSRLTALLVAELQIALITHWLSGTFPLQPETVARMLITNTQALLANGAS